MKSTKITALLLLVVMCFGVLTSCWGNNNDKTCEHNYVDGKCTECGASDPDYMYDDGTVSYNTYTSVMPSNWNELTYQDNNDTQIMSYIGSSFFDYDYAFDGDKYNADGSINFDAIVDGAYSTHYSAATKLEDVTSTVDAKWGYTDEQKADGGYAWKITLRDDLKWDDGTPITAADFVYSMQEQLNPLFMNYRGNTYYDTLRLKGAKDYFFGGNTVIMDASQVYSTYSTDLDSKLIFNIGPQHDGANGVGYFRAWLHSIGAPASYSVASVIEFLGQNGLDITVATPEIAAKMEGKTLAEIKADEEMNAAWTEILGWWQTEPNEELHFFIAEGAYPVKEWDTVGMYQVEGENAFVICLDVSYDLLTDDGELSVWAPYYMSSLPLVHKAKYEANKVEPATGATLWTSTYNSDLASTASWGPYKLVEFVAGSHYKLVKNEYWYGWNMDEYKNQYNVDAVNCRNVEDPNTAWLGFLSGTYDTGALSTDNYDDYKDSKYVTYETSTGTFGMQLFSDLETLLKNKDNNNGILAIKEFRQALNLAIDRSAVVEKIWPGSTVPCFGLLNTMYFYDIENSPNLDDGGIYRNTDIAKAGILRAYGFTETDGKWSDGVNINGATLDEAYEALTGYNMNLAKQRMQEAITILTENAEYYGYDATKNITLVYGASVDNDKQQFRCQYIQNIVNELTKGTALEGKIVLKFHDSGDDWSDNFRSGVDQIGFGYGFSGNAFNPFDIIGAFVNPDDSLNYHAYWDTSVIDMTLTLPAGDYEGAGEEHTMSVQNWYYCLNGLAEEYKQAKTFNWGSGFAPSNVRLMILSALEELVLNESRSIMLIGDAGGSFLGAKFSYCNYEYNTFMGYGGIRYLQVNYTDVEWYKFVKANGGKLENEYKKSE